MGRVATRELNYSNARGLLFFFVEVVRGMWRVIER